MLAVDLKKAHYYSYRASTSYFFPIFSYFSKIFLFIPIFAPKFLFFPIFSLICRFGIKHIDICRSALT